MSGGVDSSVAATLLLEQGYDVAGLFMRVGAALPEPAGTDCESKPHHQGCSSPNDADDARRVAGLLGIPFDVLDFRDDFEELIGYFVDEYARGRTPNPCIICNMRMKFGKIAAYADSIGAAYIATGHYARIGQRDGRRLLMRGRDPAKDQSYVLFGLDPAVLPRVKFPVGELTKDQVRERAGRLDLPVHDKPESMEICFVPDCDYVRLVRERRPEAFVPGDVIDRTGQVVGRHTGICRYTIGQRRGLGISRPNPIYVTRLDATTHTVTIGEADALLCSALTASQAKYFIDSADAPFRAAVKIRYLHKASPAVVYPRPDGNVRVVFDEPQRAVTPGQAVVFYDDDLLIGGAWIDETESAGAAS